MEQTILIACNFICILYTRELSFVYDEDMSRFRISWVLYQLNILILKYKPFADFVLKYIFFQNILDLKYKLFL